jgi:AbrB family looped-hinge helix DNA binding protein
MLHRENMLESISPHCRSPRCTSTAIEILIGEPDAIGYDARRLRLPPSERGVGCRQRAEMQKLCYAATMKATLTLTRRGVVTLPAKLRRALGLKADDQLIAETTPEGLLLRPAVTLPVEIYSEKRIREFDRAEAELANVLGRRKRSKTSAR